MNRFNVEQSLLTIAVQLSNIAFVAQALADQLKVAPAEESNQDPPCPNSTVPYALNSKKEFSQ